MAPIGDVIAANVRAERARRRWTQAELGERVGWPRSSVSDVESGRRKLTADDLVALCLPSQRPQRCTTLSQLFLRRR
ncbi:MAG: helix-turn-helix transcriptional regulator [Kineosporiaceae bacterium]|nr:helix-turn-helix transcriptional regulator [Kineosporiaceae bacterium]